MTTPLPGNLGYGTVRWTVVGIAEDSLDLDALPDAEQINGTARFTPQVTDGAGIASGAQPPVTVLPRPVSYNITNGKLVDREGRTDIRLVANDSQDTTPQGWTYLVEYELDGGYAFGSFSFTLATNEIADLTLKMPVTGTPGIVITRGPAGPPGEGYGGGFVAPTQDGNLPLPITIVSKWGIRDDGTAYYNSAGAVSSEAGLLVPDPNTGGFTIWRPGAPFATSLDTRVRDLINTVGPNSLIRTALNTVVIGYQRRPIAAIGDYTLAAADETRTLWIDSNAATRTVTIPLDSTVPSGGYVDIIQAGPLAVTIVGAAGVTIRGGSVTLGGLYQNIRMFKVNANDWLALGRESLNGAAAAGAATAATAAAALYVPLSQKGANSGVATLDSTGKIPVGQMPAVALTEWLGAVATQTAMLALTGQRGDWATRTDRGTDWQLINEPASTLANWREMTYPTSPVTSVDGRVGAVTLGTTAATADELARRTSAGRLVAADGVAASDVATVGQLVTFGRDRGTGNTLPSTDLRRGDTYYYTPLSILVFYNGLAWRMSDPGSVAAYADLANVISAMKYVGAQIRTAGRTFEWNGTIWDIVAGPPPSLMLRMTTTQLFNGNYLVPYDSVDAGSYNPGGASAQDGDFFSWEGIIGRRVFVKRDGFYTVNCSTICTISGPELRLSTVPASNNFTNGIVLQDAGGRGWAANDLNWSGFLGAGTPIGQQLRTTGSATADNPQGYRQTFTITRIGS